MKIGLVLSKTPHYSETFFISKIKGLQKSGHEVILFVQKAESQYVLSPVVVAPAVNKSNKVLQIVKSSITVSAYFFKYPKRLIKFFKLEKNTGRSAFQITKNIYTNYHLLSSDVDWLHFGFATIAIQSENVAKAIGAKMAVSLRGFDVDVYPIEHEGCYHDLWERVDKVHAISKYTLKKGIELGLSPDTDAEIITPAVDLSLFERKKQLQFIRKPEFLTVGRLHPIKGHEYVLKAFGLMNKKDVHFNYSIIGSGPLEPELKAIIEQFNLSERVKLIGQIEHDKISIYYQQADYYIQYSLSEGFCNATLEAQAMGQFCIVSDGGGLPENVIHKITGWVVPKRNVKALVDSIVEVLNLSEKENRKIREHAVQRVESEFNIGDYNKKFDSFYRA